MDPKNKIQKNSEQKNSNDFYKGDPLEHHDYSKHSKKIEDKFEYMINNHERSKKK